MLNLALLILQCATPVAQVKMPAIIKTESQNNPLAIGLNKGYKLKFQPKDPEQAKNWVEYLEKNDYNFDVGLAQINIKNNQKPRRKQRGMLGQTCLRKDPIGSFPYVA
jgi:hypothetical protein